MPYINTKLTGLALAATLVGPQAAGAVGIPALPDDVQSIKGAVEQDVASVRQTVDQTAANVAPATRGTVEQIASRTVAQAQNTASRAVVQVQDTSSRTVVQASNLSSRTVSQARSDVGNTVGQVRETRQRTLSEASRTASSARRGVYRARARAQRFALDTGDYGLTRAHTLGAQLGALLSGGSISAPHIMRGAGSIAWTNSDGCLSLQVRGIHSASIQSGC